MAAMKEILTQIEESKAEFVFNQDATKTKYTLIEFIEFGGDVNDICNATTLEIGQETAYGLGTIKRVK